jgi:hypothetical protein
MGLLIIVSRLPPTMAVTVMVKGEPATALEGAVISRVAEVPQPNVTNPATATLNADSRNARPTLRTPRRADAPENPALKHTKPGCALDTLPLPLSLRSGPDMAVDFETSQPHQHRSAVTVKDRSSDGKPIRRPRGLALL